MDALCFKTPCLLRRLTMPEARKLPVQEIGYEKLVAVLGLEFEQFVDLCILMGCDYVPNIKGIGPKKGYRSELFKIPRLFRNVSNQTNLFVSRECLFF
jgi:flap endonuclease-1